MQLAWAERSYPITGGVALSVLFHILLALLIIFGVPSFFQSEVLEAPPTIQFATLSDITAAPKVDKQGKPLDKPKPQQPPAPEQKKPLPPKPATPATPSQSTPPPAAAPQEAVAIPDETKKKPDQKKPDPKPDEKKTEKKKEDDKPKPKPKTQQDQDFSKILQDLTQNQPAPKTNEKPKPKAATAPAQPTVGQQTALVNDVPLTMSEENGIRAAIERHWNPPIGMANIESYVVMVRLYMNPDGTVSKMELIDPKSGDAGYQALADSAQRAVTIAVQTEGHLPMPRDKSYPTIVLRWNMSEVCADMGGC